MRILRNGGCTLTSLEVLAGMCGSLQFFHIDLVLHLLLFLVFHECLEEMKWFPFDFKSIDKSERKLTDLSHMCHSVSMKILTSSLWLYTRENVPQRRGVRQGVL